MSEDRAVIGYTLEPLYEGSNGMIMTRAFVLCGSCGDAISGSGGPRYNAVCLRCIEHLDLVNLIKGKSNV
jgi:hypothetical protein